MHRLKPSPALWQVLLLCVTQVMQPSVVGAEVYVTEEKVSIDRCASAWFILRFLDADATFKFFKAGEKPPPGIGFGYFGARYFNRGMDCAFTALIKQTGRQTNAALLRIESVVNDVQAWRQGPDSLQARMSRGISVTRERTASDRRVLETLFSTFDLLYLKNGGQDESYLESQKIHLQLLEFELLVPCLSETATSRLQALIAATNNYQIAEGNRQILDWLHLEFSTLRETTPSLARDSVEELAAILEGKDLNISPKTLGFLGRVVQPGIQKTELEAVLSWTVACSSTTGRIAVLNQSIWQQSEGGVGNSSSP